MPTNSTLPTCNTEGGQQHGRNTQTLLFPSLLLPKRHSPD